MSKSKQMFTEMREQEIENEFLDDDYRVQEFKSRERVSSKTLDATQPLIELFKTFGEIFSPDFNKEKLNEGKHF